MAERDEALRVCCFLALDALRARYGNDLPFVGALSDGFVYAGKRVPFLNRQKGIYRSDRAYDQDLVGVSPDYRVQLARRLVTDEDGPMLDVLKDSQGRTIELPRKQAWHPDRERLATRFERFLAAA